MNTSTKPEAEFKYADTGSGESLVVTRATKMEAYAVEYKDGAGQSQVRLAFRDPKGSTVWLAQKQIQGANVVMPANDWFRAALNKKLETNKEPESI